MWYHTLQSLFYTLLPLLSIHIIYTYLLSCTLLQYIIISCLFTLLFILHSLFILLSNVYYNEHLMDTIEYKMVDIYYWICELFGYKHLIRKTNFKSSKQKHNSITNINNNNTNDSNNEYDQTSVSLSISSSNSSRIPKNISIIHVEEEINIFIVIISIIIISYIIFIVSNNTLHFYINSSTYISSLPSIPILPSFDISFVPSLSIISISNSSIPSFSIFSSYSSYIIDTLSTLSYTLSTLLFQIITTIQSNEQIQTSSTSVTSDTTTIPVTLVESVQMIPSITVTLTSSVINDKPGTNNDVLITSKTTTRSSIDTPSIESLSTSTNEDTIKTLHTPISFLLSTITSYFTSLASSDNNIPIQSNDTSIILSTIQWFTNIFFNYSIILSNMISTIINSYTPLKQINTSYDNEIKNTIIEPVTIMSTTTISNNNILNSIVTKGSLAHPNMDWNGICGQTITCTLITTLTTTLHIQSLLYTIQLLPIILSGWNIIIYMSRNVSMYDIMYERLMETGGKNGWGTIIDIDTIDTTLSSYLLSYLSIDTSSRILFRPATHRFCDDELSSISQWMNSGYSIHRYDEQFGMVNGVGNTLLKYTSSNTILHMIQQWNQNTTLLQTSCILCTFNELLNNDTYVSII